MFYLVKFSDTNFEIYPEKKITKCQGNGCIVRDHGRYEGKIVSSNKTRELLLKEKEDLAKHYSSDIDYNELQSNINENQNFENINENSIETYSFEHVDEKENAIPTNISSFVDKKKHQEIPSNTTINVISISNTPFETEFSDKSSEVINPSFMCNMKNTLFEHSVSLNDTNNDTSILSFECVPGEIVDCSMIQVFPCSTPLYEVSAKNQPTTKTHLLHEPSENVENSSTEDLSNKTHSLYEPSENVENSSTEDISNKTHSLYEPSGNVENSSTEDISLIANINSPGLLPCNDSNMFVEKSRGRNGDKKSNFCVFCHTKQQKIARHLEIKHKDQQDVKEFLDLPKGCVERRKLIEVIRKRGNYLFNTDSTFNDGELIVSRRPRTNSHKCAQDFKACGNCKAYFAKNTLRTHFAKCKKKDSKSQRIAMLMSKEVMGRVHPRASKTVRQMLLPPLREDHIVRLIRYDELIILFANKMTEKYKNSRYFEMIRQKMRLIGRFLACIKNINANITDLSSVFDPKYIDDTMQSINIEAGLDEETKSYKTPTVAFSLGTLLKQLGNILINDSIKKHATEIKINTENYLKLLNEEVAVNINRDVAESQFQLQRRKKIELPLMEDIKHLHYYLLNQRNHALAELKKEFSVSSWTKLAEFTLVSVLLFNRRRAGEVERILIDDFSNYQGITETDENAFDKLSSEGKKLAKKYVRFLIRGKLNRNVPVLLDHNLLECIKLILKHRGEANVSARNPYVFGIYSSDKKNNRHLRACNLLRQFSVECGAKYPHRLRGTQLRKHIATACINLNLTENELSDLANFMGHHVNIHKNFYRQPVVTREITRMSKLLEVAQGANEESDECNEENISVTSNQSEQESEPRIETPKQKKRSTSPYGSVKRTRWSEEEKSVIYKNFHGYITQKKLPSLKEIQEVITKNPRLQRTTAQVKTWIHNQYKLIE